MNRGGHQSAEWSTVPPPTGIYLYDAQEWTTLKMVTTVGSSAALGASLLTCLSFAYMFFTDRARASRISLHCVLMSSVTNAIADVFLIININVGGNSEFCRVSSIIVAYVDTVSTAFLTIVGINLVLIFVIKVKRTSILEYCYYPTVAIYGLVAISVPCFVMSKINLEEGNNYSCWYFIRYGNLAGLRNLYWMTYYGFIFFLIVVALICSLIALGALLRESRLIHQRLPPEQTESGQALMFHKVVLRCIIYPLLPFIVHIWGFIKQVFVMDRETSPSYPLALLDVIFSSFEGFLVTMVFFMDPAITSFVRDRLSQWQKAYVDEFSKIAVFTPKHNGDLEQVVVIDQPAGQEPDPERNRHAQTAYHPSVQMAQISLQHHKLKIIPVRRVSVTQSIYSRITAERSTMGGSTSRLSVSYNVLANQYPSLMVGADGDHRVLIPYRYPHLALILHWLFSRWAS